MKLNIKEIQIENIDFSEESKIENNILYINKREVLDFILEDNRIKSCDIELARPGESVRIVPVKDVIEPRTKMDGSGFPGILNKIAEAGTGETIALKNCAVVTTGPIVGFQEGIIDMSGPLTDYQVFSHLNNIVLIIEKKENISTHEHEELVRLSGIRLADYLAQIGRDVEGDKKEIQWKSISEKSKSELPKFVYIYLHMAQGLLHDTYFYGENAQGIIPTLMSPGEIYDGALISGNCVSPGSKTTTWHHQNNAIIEEGLKRDGKDINFLGIIICPLKATLDDKYRNTIKTAQLAELLGAEASILSQEGFGNPTTDLMLICEYLENKGIKTVLISNEDAGTDGLSEPLPDGNTKADAIISTGNSNANINLPPMDKVIGDLNEIERITGGFHGSIKEDGSLNIEIHAILGGHNLQGRQKLSAISI